MRILCGLVICAAGVLLLCSQAVNAASYALFYQEGLADAGEYGYILVPGAGISILGPGSKLKDRLDAAIALYAQRPTATILVSGAYNAAVGLHEADVMREYLIGNGIPAEAVLEDRYGQSTYETLRRAKAYLGGDEVVVCTQELYMPRTMYLAQSL